jgi:hypothetical protein
LQELKTMVGSKAYPQCGTTIALQAFGQNT